METLNKKLKRLLITEETYTILEIISDCQNIFSESKYREFIKEKVGQLICTDFFAHTLVYQKGPPDSNNETQYLNISSYPEEWIRRYKEKNYSMVDSTVMIAMSQNNISFTWQEAYQQIPPPQYFIDEAAEFGLRDGTIVTTTSPTPPLNRSIFSVAGDENNERTKTVLEALVPHFHYAIEQIASVTNTELLTPREKEVLALQERKYSRDEIADKLNISRRTINFHLDNIFKKLDSPNVSNVIFERFRRGIIIDEF